nr:hypothetical protein BaRGS_002877 [Batillaria attramentaria]
MLSPTASFITEYAKTSSSPVSSVEGQRPGESQQALCVEQREMLRVLFAVVGVLRDLLVLPIGAFFDKYGTTRTRLLTV